MKLRCVSRYSSGVGTYQAGEMLAVGDELGAYLLRDSPGSFVVWTEEAEQATEPTVSDVPAVDRRARGGRRRTQ